MSELNRRQFVVAAVVAGAACACGGETLAADEKNPPPSPEKIVDVGSIDEYAKDGVSDKFGKSNRILVIRHEGKIYAPTATCSHKNCLVKLKGENLACPCHGSRFTLDGVPTKGPAKYPLYRYGITKDDKGHLIVDKTKQFEEKQWDEAGAFVKV